MYYIISTMFVVTLDLLPCLVLASWCALGFPFISFWISLRSESILCIFARIIILCDLSFKQVYVLNVTLQLYPQQTKFRDK